MKLYKMIEEPNMVRLDVVGLWDIVDWWFENYPSDIFIKNPLEVIKIRDLMVKLKEKKKA